ncbi:hypothetical protein VTJ49DRAFT_6340 [Mycothermus thermophilus]|uniref:Uncharacterized protein n=1 Tax=Humicola insolens TaxID=85995 RepID=A0ABR3V2U8_HUMIN
MQSECETDETAPGFGMLASSHRIEPNHGVEMFGSWHRVSVVPRELVATPFWAAFMLMKK